MSDEKVELTPEEKKEFEEFAAGLMEGLGKAKIAADEFIDISKKILMSNDINPYEEIDELEEEAKEVYNKILFGIENPLKIPHKEYNREANLLLTDKFLNKIIVSEVEFIKIYKEAFKK